MQTLKEVYKDFPVEALINIEDSNLYCKVENAMIKNAVFSVGASGSLKDKNDLNRLIRLKNYKDILESYATCINEKYCDKDNHYSLTYTFKKKDC